MSLIKCPECGAEISDEVNSCPNCGYPLATVNDSRNNSKNKKIWISIISILIIIAIGILYYINFASPKEPIIGEWEFELFMGEDSDSITKETFSILGYENIFFRATKDYYELGIPSNIFINDTWTKVTDEALTEKYAYVYSLDESNRVLAVIESKEDLNTLHIFINSDSGTTLLEFSRVEE